MLVERTFWPVGHGGFFSERIFSKEQHRYVTVVYDCGTLRHKTRCYDRIDDFLHPRHLHNSIRHLHKSMLYAQQLNNRCLHCAPFFDELLYEWHGFSHAINCIDILFITHFDKDHINCIAQLVSQVYVKNIVIPYYDNYDLLYLRTIKGSPLSSIDNDILSSLNLPSSTRVYRILPENGLDDVVQDDNQDYPSKIIIGDGSNWGTTIRSKTKLCLRETPDWFWAVFNYDRPHNTPRIRKEIQELLIDEGKDPADLTYLIDNLNVKRIREKINAIYGDSSAKNNGSLVIFSGCADTSQILIHLSNPLSKKLLHISFIGACGFSYMGDYNCKSATRLNAYLDFISPYKNQLSGIQIPHHGSSNNFSSEILRGTQWGIAAVPNESAKHPHATVWAQMNLHGFAFLIDEDKESLLMQHFEV